MFSPEKLDIQHITKMNNFDFGGTDHKKLQMDKIWPRQEIWLPYRDRLPAFDLQGSFTAIIFFDRIRL